MIRDALQETIIGPATAMVPSGIGIIRISGPKAYAVASQRCQQDFLPRRAQTVSFYTPEGKLLDEGIGLFFKGPNSFTGEDVFEFQGHGSPIVMQAILEACLRTEEVRLAEPGEFSQRAFLNQKLDLVQVEAIADLITSEHAQAAEAAIQSLKGVFSEKIERLSEALLLLRAHLEAEIDFSEETNIQSASNHFFNETRNLYTEVEKLYSVAKERLQLQTPATVVLAGMPNAGKSSLFNKMIDKESAIVTSVPGTTRDALKEPVQFGKQRLSLIDTAGLRETRNTIEQLGIQKALLNISEAKMVLLVVDGLELQKEKISCLKKLEDLVSLIKQTINDTRVCLQLVCTKADLCEKKVLKTTLSLKAPLWVSSKTGEGISELKRFIEKSLVPEIAPQTFFSVRKRHVLALQQTSAYLKEAVEVASHSYLCLEQLAESLRCAQQTLGEITGKVWTEDLLGKIFSTFCIGK